MHGVMLKHRIDCIFARDHEKQNPAFIANDKEITGDAMPGLHIYSLQDIVQKIVREPHRRQKELSP